MLNISAFLNKPPRVSLDKACEYLVFSKARLQVRYRRGKGRRKKWSALYRLTLNKLLRLNTLAETKWNAPNSGMAGPEKVRKQPFLIIRALKTL